MNAMAKSAKTESGVPSDLAVPPGEYLAEVIGELGMNKAELATRMARPASKLSRIFKGEKAITADTALQLEKVVGVPARIRLGLESEYRLNLARLETAQEPEHLKSETGLVDSFCYKELVEFHAVAERTRPAERAAELQRFFAVATLHAVLEVRRYQAVFRCGASPAHGHSRHATATWLRLAEIRARGIDCAPFNKLLLQNSLQKIRAMSLLTPKEFLGPLSELLANSGVALVVNPHFRGTMAHGATFWLGREKSVLLLTIHGKWTDLFWLSLFHELGHILLHDRQSVFLEDGCAAPEEAAQETAADLFAADALIPPKGYERFLKHGIFTPFSVRGFADRLGIDVGIVIRRLQHDGHVKHGWNNDLRKRYDNGN